MSKSKKSRDSCTRCDILLKSINKKFWIGMGKTKRVVCKACRGAYEDSKHIYCKMIDMAKKHCELCGQVLDKHEDGVCDKCYKNL